MILKWLRSSHRMCAARHCPQFATCKQQLTRQHVGGPMNASVFWTVAIPTLSQNIKSKWRGYFKSQMHGHVGKLKVQPQVSKAIPRAAPSVEVLWPKCNAPEIAKPLKAPTLQGFFFKATTAGFRQKQTFKSCNWGPSLLNENSQKFLFLNFFRACQRRNIRLMTLSGLNMIHDATFKLQLLRNAFPVESCLFHLILHVSILCSSIPSLPKFNLSCLRFYRQWEHVNLESPLLLFEAPGFRKMKSVLAPWPECHGVAPNPWLGTVFPVPTRFLGVWACVFQKVRRWQD